MAIGLFRNAINDYSKEINLYAKQSLAYLQSFTYPMQPIYLKEYNLSTASGLSLGTKQTKQEDSSSLTLLNGFNNEQSTQKSILNLNPTPKLTSQELLSSDQNQISSVFSSLLTNNKMTTPVPTNGYIEPKVRIQEPGENTNQNAVKRKLNQEDDDEFGLVEKNYSKKFQNENKFKGTPHPVKNLKPIKNGRFAEDSNGNEDDDEDIIDLNEDEEDEEDIDEEEQDMEEDENEDDIEEDEEDDEDIDEEDEVDEVDETDEVDNEIEIDHEEIVEQKQEETTVSQENQEEILKENKNSEPEFVYSQEEELEEEPQTESAVTEEVSAQEVKKLISETADEYEDEEEYESSDETETVNSQKQHQSSSNLEQVEASNSESQSMSQSQSQTESNLVAQEVENQVENQVELNQEVSNADQVVESTENKQVNFNL